MTRLTIALAVRSTHVCAGALGDGTSSAPRWTASRPFGNGETLAEAAAGLLGDARAIFGNRMDVLLSVGPIYSRLKRIERAPIAARDDELGAAVGGNLPRFFLGEASNWSLLGWRRHDGQLWVSVVDPAVLEAVVAAGQRRGLLVRACTPAVCAVAAVSPDGVREWSDGSSACALVVRGGRVVRVQSLRQASDKSAVASLDDLLGVSAAVAHGSPACFPASDRASKRTRWLVRLGAQAAAVLFLSVAVIGPFAWSIARAREATSKRAEIAVGVRDAIRAAAATERDVADLQAITDFLSTSEERRLSVQSFLEALPDGAVLAGLRVDSLGVTATVVAPESLDVLGAFARAHGLSKIAAVGALASETQNGERYHRLVVTARLNAGGAVQDDR